MRRGSDRKYSGTKFCQRGGRVVRVRVCRVIEAAIAGHRGRIEIGYSNGPEARYPERTVQSGRRTTIRTRNESTPKEVVPQRARCSPPGRSPCVEQAEATGGFRAGRGRPQPNISSTSSQNLLVLSEKDAESNYNFTTLRRVNSSRWTCVRSSRFQSSLAWSSLPLMWLDRSEARNMAS
jgi:hypothetical protein